MRQTITMMLGASAFVLAGLTSAPTANAHPHKVHATKTHAPKTRAAKIRYGGKPGRGYWRPGPARGHGFGFATYKGDPFGKNDYFDGERCHYLRGKNVCAANVIFNGFWDRPTQR